MMKRFFAEFIGAFVIVFAPVAVSASAAIGHTDHGLLVAALVSGLPVLAMIYAVGSISAAHFNPAAAAGFAILLFGIPSGSHIPLDPSMSIRNLGLEITISARMTLVIISVATDKRVSGTVPALVGPMVGASLAAFRRSRPVIPATSPWITLP